LVFNGCQNRSWIVLNLKRAGKKNYLAIKLLSHKIGKKGRSFEGINQEGLTKKGGPSNWGNPLVGNYSFPGISQKDWTWKEGGSFLGI